MIRNEIEVSKESKRGRRFLGWSNNRVDVQNLMRCFFLVAVAVVEVAGLLEAFCFLDVIKGNTSCSVNCGAGGAIFCGQKIKKSLLMAPLTLRTLWHAAADAAEEEDDEDDDSPGEVQLYAEDDRVINADS